MDTAQQLNIVSIVHMVPTVREKSENLKKFGNFTFQSQGKIRRSESQGKSKYQSAKVNKDAEQIVNCFTQTAYNNLQFTCFPVIKQQILNIKKIY